MLREQWKILFHLLVTLIGILPAIPVCLFASDDKVGEALRMSSPKTRIHESIPKRRDEGISYDNPEKLNDYLIKRNSPFDFSLSKKQEMPKDGWILKETKKYRVTSMVKPIRGIWGGGELHWVGLTPNDISNFVFLDSLNIKGSASPKEYARIFRIIHDSDLRDLIVYGVQTLGNIPNPPDNVVNKLLRLQGYMDYPFQSELVIAIAKLKVPRTFPVLLAYHEKYFEEFNSTNAINVVSQFEIESLAGLPMVASFLNSKGGQYTIYEPGITYLRKIPKICLSFCGNGLGVFVWYSVSDRPRSWLKRCSQPVLPTIMNSLKGLRK